MQKCRPSTALAPGAQGRNIASRVLSNVSQARFAWRRTLLLAALLVGGCVTHVSSDTPSPAIESPFPAMMVVDFTLAPCETLWSLEDNLSLSNALYWQRAMDCAARLDPPTARAQAERIHVKHWDDTFKQSILLAVAEPDTLQRQQLLANVDNIRSQMPSAVRPLVQLWRDSQAWQVALNDEKANNQRLQALNDSKIAGMLQVQNGLQESLADTRRKLENLTDIERQLSSRKQLQGDISDGASGQKTDTSSKASGSSSNNVIIPKSTQ
jgi:hypothetical protein